jgi:3-methyladenine DNA glycosylase/8-oxoguanine DNA glycosylase
MRPAPATGCERVVLQAPFAVDVRRTIAAPRCGPYDPTFRIERAAVWRALRTDCGPATLHVEPTDAGIVASAWGPGAGRALEQLPAMLGFHDDDEDFVAHHRVVARAHARHRGLRIGRGGALTETVVATVIEQKVTSTEAHRSWSALVRRYGEPAPGPAVLRLPPRPELLAELGYADWHPLGVERRRAETIRRICARADRLRDLESAPPAEVRRVLEHFPGVGPWTSTTATVRALGDRDAVVIGDYHFPHIVCYTLTGARRGSDEQMVELLAPYRGHRTRALQLMLLGGSRPPRRGPRAPLRSIKGI